MTYQSDFQKAIKALCHRHHLWQVWADFCAMSALSIANSVTLGPDRDRREQQYMETVKRYSSEEAKQIARLFGMTTMALEDEPHDFLGDTFMALELGSQWGGQFFTPTDLCTAMARLQVGPEAQQAIEQRGFITVHDPACGAGAMIIGVVKDLMARKVNYQQALHATCIDVDATAAYMAYIQLSLLHVPAVVVIGNTLSMEMRETLCTPAHVLGLWDRKLERGYALGSPAAASREPAPEALDLGRLTQGDMFGDREDAA